MPFVPQKRLALWFSLVLRRDTVIVWSLNAKFEPDRDKVDKSTKLIQFPWDMSIKSEVSAQEKNFLLPYEIGNTCAAMLGNHAFFLKIVFATVLKGKMAQNQCRDLSE